MCASAGLCRHLAATESRARHCHHAPNRVISGRHAPRSTSIHLRSQRFPALQAWLGRCRRWTGRGRADRCCHARRNGHWIDRPCLGSHPCGPRRFVVDRHVRASRPQGPVDSPAHTTIPVYVGRRRRRSPPSYPLKAPRYHEVDVPVDCLTRAKLSLHPIH